MYSRGSCPCLRRGALALCLATGVVLGLAPTATATPGPDQPSESAAAQPSPRSPDFLFNRPRGSIGVRGSWLFERAGSKLFDFLQDQLTVERRDFDAPAFGVDLGMAVTPRVDALFGFDFSRRSKNSEYRKFVDNNRLPITQTTRLTQANLSGSVKVAATPRGRAVSRFAWVPRGVTPYVGVGGGFLWYAFEQDGDFVDFVDNKTIFTSHFRSSGWTPSAHAFAGTDLKLLPRLFLTLEGRYVWAHADLDRDFSGFDPIDLAGFKLTAGVNLLF